MSREAFELWWDNDGMHRGNRGPKARGWHAWQAAEAHQAKRVEELEAALERIQESNDE